MITKNWILIVFALAFTTNVLASNPPKMNVISLDNTKALVAVEQTQPEKSVLSIESEEGYIVYYKETNELDSGFKTIFDLSDLKDGSYTVKFKTGTALVKRDVNIDNGEVSVASMETEYAPVFVMDGNILKVSYLNFNKSEMNLLVYDNEDLVFHSDLGQDFNVQKGFDLSGLKKGDYDINLVASGEDYWFSVKR